MEKLKIKFQPLFWMYVFVCIYFGWLNQIFYYIVVATLHEYGHLFVAKWLGYKVDGVIYSFYGVGLKTNNVYKIKHDVIVSLAGPFVNLIMIILIINLWWIFPTTYFFTYDFVICNIVVMIFNLFPIYPLDGGRVVVALLSQKYKIKTILKINNIICYVLSGILIVLFVITLFYVVNFSLLFVAIFLFLNTIINDSNSYYSRISAYNKRYSKPVEVKTFRVDSLSKDKLLKYLSPHYYSIFECINNGKIEVIEEKDLI